MASFQFNVNSQAVIHLTAKLERLNKHAFPAAVRATLSDGAFEMKKTNILESAKRNMTVRNKTVFKKFTGVEKAKFNSNVESMKATVGFIPKDGLKGSKVPKGMEANEFGGVDDDGWMYMPKTRTSNSKDRLVRKGKRFDKGKVLNIRRARNIATKKASRFIINASESFNQKKAFHFYSKNNIFLVQATSFSQNSRGGTNIKLDFLMRRRKDFKAKAKPTHFVKESAIRTQKQMEGFYQKNATFQFNKVLKSTR